LVREGSEKEKKIYISASFPLAASTILSNNSPSIKAYERKILILIFFCSKMVFEKKEKLLQGLTLLNE